MGKGQATGRPQIVKQATRIRADVGHDTGEVGDFAHKHRPVPKPRCLGHSAAPTTAGLCSAATFQHPHLPAPRVLAPPQS